MLKSVTRVVSKQSNVSQRNGYRVGMPKTRFNLNDKSLSSPRLKSFPAERIKRYERSPVRNSPDKSVMPSRQVLNSGQGDTTIDIPNSQLSQSLAMTGENITSTSEQRVSGNVYPMESHVNQSELVIPSGRMDNSSKERPHHRPYVPNVYQANTLRDTSPRQFRAQRTNGFTETNQTAAIGNNEIPQRPVASKIDDSTKCVNREQIENLTDNNGSNVITNSQEGTVARGHELIPDKSLITEPNVSNIGRTTDETFPNFPRQIQPRLSNVSHYYNRNNVPLSRRQYVEINSGMTSPQDVAINQTKNYQRFGNCLCASNQGNNWIFNNQPEVMNNVIPVVNDNSSQYCNHRNHGTQGMTNEHKNFSGSWQHAAEKQYYHRPNQILEQTSGQSSNDVKLEHHRNEKCQLIQQAVVPDERENLAGNWQNAKEQQFNNQQSEILSDNRQSLKNMRSDNDQKIREKKKSLRFSSAMIRDQEMLVTTMRQQGINEDIMRRQFDALLAEQRKQLLYLEQLEKSTNNETKVSVQRRRVQRKISTIEEDGKPEWMLHITPPRIPYSVVEKMQSERKDEPRMMIENNPKAFGMISDNQPQNHRNEIHDRETREYYQHPWQMTGSNVCHPQHHSYVPNINVPRENQTCDINGNIVNQYRQKYYEYPVYQQQQTHQQNYGQQLPSENRQTSSNNNIKNQQYENQEKIEKNIEPSSLLKLRIYKDVVKRQKQNNGLQDPETVKEAIEALKSPANRKGLEYLENLNKKREKPVSLNGAQDPQVVRIINDENSYVCHQQTPKIPSANGLENSRNPNNPSPPRENLRPRKINEFHALEYPRQRKNVHFRECYSLMAEKENGTVATTNQQYYDPRGMNDNQMTSSNNVPSKSDCPNFHYSGQINPAIGYNDRSMPFAFPPNQHPRYHPQHIQQYYGNPEKTRHQINTENCHPGVSQPGFFVNETSGNVQRQELSYSRNNNDLQEAIMIGGIKYLARKPVYSGVSSQNYPTDGKSFNPMITCT